MSGLFDPIDVRVVEPNRRVIKHVDSIRSETDLEKGLRHDPTLQAHVGRMLEVTMIRTLDRLLEDRHITQEQHYRFSNSHIAIHVAGRK